MNLTAKQEKFCQSIADGLNQSDAYRSAYNAGAMKPETVQSKASILMADGKVRARVIELRAALSDKALWTREDSVRALKTIADGLGADTRPMEAVAAVKELNAMHGYNEPAKMELTGKNGVPLLAPLIPAELPTDPKELATLYAKALG